MSMALGDVISAGMDLNPDEREIAALALQQQGNADEQAAVDAAWRDTIARRLDELESGRVQPVDGRETFAIMRARNRVSREARR